MAGTGRRACEAGPGPPRMLIYPVTWCHLCCLTFARQLVESRTQWWSWQPAHEQLVGETSDSQRGEGVVFWDQASGSRLVYWPEASMTGALDLSSEPAGIPMRLSWFNPRPPYGSVGQPVSFTTTGGMWSGPAPPSDAGQDWLGLLEYDG